MPRFFIKALRDLGLGVSFGEPFKRLFNQGIILGPTAAGCRNRAENVVNPDTYVQTKRRRRRPLLPHVHRPLGFGRTVRNTSGMSGVESFIQRFWTLILDGFGALGSGRELEANADARRLLHKTIKVVTERIERFNFNTMLSELMTATNGFMKMRGKISPEVAREISDALVLMIAPSAPHLAEELWHRLGHDQSVHLQSWPTYDEALTVDSMVTLVIQVNGKVRDKIEVAASIDEAEARPG